MISYEKNVNYNDGIKCLANVKSTRMQICKLEQVLWKAEGSLNRTEGDVLWKKIYQDSKEQLAGLNDKLINLDQKFCLLKMECSSIEWKNLLIQKGYILAETTNIKHVKDSMEDETDLTTAISTSLSMIEHLKVDLANAKENNYEDDQIILEAEINWLIHDLRRHHWGQQALNQIIETKKRVA